MHSEIYVPGIAARGAARRSALAEEQLHADNELSLILFDTDGNSFALPTMSVLEVVQASDVVRIPRAPAFIEGIIEIRGQVIPVVDLRKKLGYRVLPVENSIILVALVGGKKTGFIVDSARKVVSLMADEMQDIAPILSGAERRFVYRTISRGNQPIVILNTDTLLNDEEISSLDTVAGVAA